MDIQAFICNWRGHSDNAIELERQVGQFVPVTVVNTDQELRRSHTHWIHLDVDCYFAAQWNCVLERFEGDLLLHMQADASFSNFAGLFERIRQVTSRHKIGAYEPNIDFTGFKYDTSKLRRVEEDLYEVPTTDSTCWLIHGEVVRSLPVVDVSVNKYGWGISPAIAALSHLSGRICVRDYRFEVFHPRSRGYDTQEAIRQRSHYLQTLDSSVKSEIARIYNQFAKSKC